MNADDFLITAHKRYWKVALWVTAGITLVILLASNVLYWTTYMDALLISVGFSLLFNAIYAHVLRNLVEKGQGATVKSFMAYAAMRLLAAIALLGGYAVVKDVQAHDMIPLFVVFSIYFILLDVVDVIFMVKVQKAKGGWK